MIVACVQIAAGGGQQDDVARREIGLVQPAAKPVRGGRADRPADEQRPPALARTIEMERVDHLRCQAGRDVLVLPVVPGLRLRQVPVGANDDAGNQQDEDGDRPEMPFAPGRLDRRRRGLAGRYARRRDRRAGRRPAEAIFPALAISRSTIGPRCKPTRSGSGWPDHALYEFMAEDDGGDASGIGPRHRDRLNERRRCAWSQPAWRRACPWPVRELNPSRRRVPPR